MNWDFDPEDLTPVGCHKTFFMDCHPDRRVISVYYA